MTKGNGFTMDSTSSDKKDTLPKIDFSSFILSLYSSGLVQLGKVEDPSTGKKAANLDLAKHTINMIAMLEEKTRGNLDKDENNLLKSLLGELRIAFVEAKS
ncbi:MAG: DUF1844 domain-containing protein [Desulfobacula sp.]|nr:DUF1844 domain-containing protein [Desulfobacula sp.]